MLAYPKPPLRDGHLVLRGIELDDGAVKLGVFDTRTDKLLGSTQLRSLDDGACALTFGLEPGARGSGVATRAVTLTCQWAFDTLGVHRIEALTDPDNPDSDRVLERLNFTFEGVRRGADKRSDGYHDRRIWSLLATDRR